jgi:DNA polymerase-3 subunit beta
MKCTIPAGNFAAALSLVAPLARGKIAKKIPSLGAVTLTAHQDGIVSIRASNLDVDITLSVAAEVEAVGKAAIDAETIRTLVARLPKAASVRITIEGGTAVVQSDGSRSALPLFPIDELPPTLDLVDESGRAIVAHKDALALFTRPLFAVSTETARYYLNGILLHNDAAGNLCGVGTDGHRLAKIAIDGAGALSPDHSCIVPLITAKSIGKLLGAHCDVVSVTLRRSRSLFEVAGGQFRITAKVIDGTFPDYERVIAGAGGRKNMVVIDRAGLMAALARNMTATVAVLIWQPGQNGLQLVAHDNNVTHGTRLCFVPIEDTCGQGRVAIKVRHLSSVLKAFDKSQAVTIDAGNVPGGVPVLLTGDGAEAGFSVIQMPMVLPKAVEAAEAVTHEERGAA